MKNIFKCSAFNVSLFAFLIVLVSCDDPGLINFKTERSDFYYNISKIDTLDVFLQTINEDSIRTESFSYNMLGSYSDNLLGNTTASVFTEFRLPKTLVDYGSGRIFDSLVLVLKYANDNNSFGWIDDEISLNVHEINQRIYIDTPYYSTSTIAYNPVNVGSWKSTLKANGLSTIRIHLDASLGNKILNGSNEQLGDEVKFKELLKGLAIIPKVTNQTGQIVRLDLENDTSGLILYFHNSTGAMESKFQINDKCARINKFSHDFSFSEAYNQILTPKNNYPNVYLKPLSGLKVQVNFPNLSYFNNLGPVAINRAELILHPQLVYPYANYSIPSLLLLLTDSSNTNYSMTDRYEDYYGGKYNASNNTYSFIITRYIQNSVNQFLKNPNYKSKYKLNLIIPSDNPILAYPMVLSNINTSGKTTTELKIYYTKFFQQINSN